MTRPTGAILTVCCALVLALGAQPAAANNTKPAPAPAVHAAPPKAPAPMAAPKPGLGAPKPAIAGAGPGFGAKPNTPALHAAAPGPAPGHLVAPAHGPLVAPAHGPLVKEAAGPGPAHRDAAPPGMHAGMAGPHGPDAHPAAFRPRELAHDDPARAHGRFDEHVRNTDRERDIAHLHEHDFHVRDVRHFRGEELNEWRDGRWHRDFYNGRLGWWYDVDGVWYPYAAPVYPYPLEVAPLLVEEAAPVDPEAAVMVVAAPPAVTVPPLPALPHAAYYCKSGSGFYPALAVCDTDWVTLAAH
jgi:hypothetical protein